MVQSGFVSYVTDIFAYYQREKPKDRTMDLWFDEVRNIPDEALDWISSRIFKESERLPSNLPATTWALYNAWLQANPNKRAFAQERDCPDCEGGWLVLQKRLPMYAIPISHSAPCGRCRQVVAKRYVKLFEAIANGYERVNLASHTTARKSLKEMIDSIGKPAPKPRVYVD